MKYIITLLLIIPIVVKSQTTIISVTIQARDCEYIGSFTGTDDKYQDLDSALKSKFRPAATAPSGTTNVTLGGVTASVWFDVLHKLRYDHFASFGNNNPWTRTEAALRLVNNSWLNGAMDADAIDFDVNGYTIFRGLGRGRLKRE